MNRQEDIEKVCIILKRELPTLSNIPLASNTPLLSSGLLDSFAIITLVSALEADFDINIDVEKIELVQFETPTAIARLCTSTHEFT